MTPLTYDLPSFKSTLFLFRVVLQRGFIASPKTVSQEKEPWARGSPTRNVRKRFFNPKMFSAEKQSFIRVAFSWQVLKFQLSELRQMHVCEDYARDTISGMLLTTLVLTWVLPKC